MSVDKLDIIMILPTKVMSNIFLIIILKLFNVIKYFKYIVGIYLCTIILYRWNVTWTYFTFARVHFNVH